MISGVLLGSSCSAQSDNIDERDNSEKQQDRRRGTPPIDTDGEWPRFRGPGGVGLSDATGLPLKYLYCLGKLWNQQEAERPDKQIVIT